MDTSDISVAKATPHVFDGFVSYATDPDRNLVRDVESFIEGLHKESLLPREFREPLALCVDGHDFPASAADPERQTSIKVLMQKVVLTHQETSRCLLVFSGAETIDHPWINNEIAWWRARDESGPIVFVLTHGQLSVDESGEVVVDGVYPKA